MPLPFFPSPFPAAGPLTLERVLRIIDATHPKVASARLERPLAEGKLREKRAAFDPRLDLDLFGQRYNPNSAPGKAYEFDQTGVEVEQLLRDGSKIAVGRRAAFGDIKSPNTASGPLGEFYVGFKLPLLRDRGINAKLIEERRALLGLSEAEAVAAETRLDVRFDGAFNYWDWVAAGRRLALAREQLTLAQDRARFIRRRVEEGDAPDVDRIEAEAEVAVRETSAVKAERDLEKAGLKLSLYLWQPERGPTVPPFAALPPDLPEPRDFAPAVLRIAEADATRQRPELNRARLARQGFDLDLQDARNDQRPNLDLVLQPGWDPGRGGIGSTWKAGLELSFPFGFNAGAGRETQARAKATKTDLEVVQLTGQVETEVRDAWSALTTARRRYVAAIEAVRLQRALLAKERIRFEEGEGSLFLLNQRERALADAIVRRIEVAAEWNVGLAAFRAAAGGL